MASRKGSPNKVGAQVKENFLAVFTRLGSTAAMAKWAKKNQSEFYKLYARLIPTEVVGEFTIRDATELSDAELASIATGGSAGATEAPVSLKEPPGVH